VLLGAYTIYLVYSFGLRWRKSAPFSSTLQSGASPKNGNYEIVPRSEGALNAAGLALQRHPRRPGPSHRKMLAIGPAMLSNPKLLLLDGPTKGFWIGVIEEIADIASTQSEFCRFVDVGFRPFTTSQSTQE